MPLRETSEKVGPRQELLKIAFIDKIKSMSSLIKLKLLPTIFLTALLICVFIVLKTSSIENIPNEDPANTEKLNRAITESKLSIDTGILALENLNELPDYTNYKKDYILARLYEEKKENKQAISIYERLLNKNYPLKERVIFHYASLNAAEGNDGAALRYFNKLINDFPRSRSVPQAKYYLAQTQFRLKLKDQALSTLHSLKANYPKTQFGIATNYYLGEDAYNKKDYKMALEYWREYLKLSPDGRFANDIASVLESEKSIQLEPSDYSLLGDVFFHKKDYIKAVHYYRANNNSRKYYQLGYSLFRTNNKIEAAHYLKEYAYGFPKSKNARWALYYAAACTPSFMQKAFWSKITKDIPSLAYYTTYKEALSETIPYKREKLLTDYISLFPDSEFIEDATWEIMWQKIKEGNYTKAEGIGKKFLEAAISNGKRSETLAKIGFWLGKISELTNQKTKALEYYESSQNLLLDNYYSFRASDRLLALVKNKNTAWSLQSKTIDLENKSWSIPQIVKAETLKKYFGSTVSELVSLMQYDEAIDLIGKSQFPSKQITAWLKALNNEYESSINIANSLTASYNLKENSPIWKLAYPLHFWEYILSTCKRYNGLDPLLVCGVIRQESRFETNATSISNAYGLMQLISPTAKTVARQINLNLSSSELLFNPRVNIELGVNYLNGLINEFNNPLFAVASYNAGPHAVKRWINDFQASGRKDLDFFVEEIPYEQTRTYVKKVFSSYWTYLKLYTESSINQ